MPEGDTIFRAAQTMHRALAGRRVTRFQSGYAQLATVDRASPIAGRTVERVDSIGKHLLIHFSGGLVLRTHMRMNGSWHLYRPGERWRRSPSRARIVLETDAFVAVGFDVPVAELLREEALARAPALRDLGPDLLAPQFDEATALQRLKADPSRPIEAALLDQRAMAGVGNVFKSEILFACRIHPFTPVGALDGEKLLEVVRTARSMLEANSGVPLRGASIAWLGRRRTTGRMPPKESLWVYGRTGAPCRRCGTAIASRRQGLEGRSTFWCPARQPEVEVASRPQRS